MTLTLKKGTSIRWSFPDGSVRTLAIELQHVARQTVFGTRMNAVAVGLNVYIRHHMVLSTNLAILFSAALFLLRSISRSPDLEFIRHNNRRAATRGKASLECSRAKINTWLGDGFLIFLIYHRPYSSLTEPVRYTFTSATLRDWLGSRLFATNFCQRFS